MKSNIEAEVTKNYEKESHLDLRGDAIIKTEYEETEIKIENFDDNLEDLHHSIDIKQEDEVQNIKKRQSDCVNHSTKVFSEEVYLKRTFVCDSCGYQTTNKSILRTHIKTHILNKLESVCALDVSKRYQIRQATLSNWLEKNDKVGLCSEKLTNASGLRLSLNEEENAEVHGLYAEMNNEELPTCSTIKAILVNDARAKPRNSHMNALKRRSLKKSGLTAKKLTPWKYEQEMLFLQSFLYNRDTQTNLGESSQKSLGFEKCTLNVGNENDEPEISHPRDKFVFKSEELFQSSSKRRQEFEESNNLIKTKLSPADEMVQIVKTNAEYRKSNSENEPTKQNEFDESHMFYLSMSQQAKRLPALDQAKIKLELCNLMQQAEIRQIENQAISCDQLNSSHS